MQFAYIITEDDDYTPWGESEIIAEETEKMNNGEWTAYVVTVRVAGPVASSAENTGCVVPTTDTGTYHDAAAIQDAHLRGVAEELADQIEASYLAKLTTRRDEINAMIQQMGGN